jgi:hypothetical protein
MADRERLLVELESLLHNAPAVNRLKRCLKAALRMYGLRCTDVRQVKPPPPPATPDGCNVGGEPGESAAG